MTLEAFWIAGSERENFSHLFSSYFIHWNSDGWTAQFDRMGRRITTKVSYFMTKVWLIIWCAPLLSCMRTQLPNHCKQIHVLLLNPCTESCSFQVQLVPSVTRVSVLSFFLDSQRSCRQTPENISTRAFPWSKNKGSTTSRSPGNYYYRITRF